MKKRNMLFCVIAVLLLCTVHISEKMMQKKSVKPESERVISQISKLPDGYELFCNNLIVARQIDVDLPDNLSSKYNACRTVFTLDQCEEIWGNNYIIRADGVFEWAKENCRYLLYPSGNIAIDHEKADAFLTLIGYTLTGDDWVDMSYSTDSDIDAMTRIEAQQIIVGLIDKLPFPTEFLTYDYSIQIASFPIDTINSVIQDLTVGNHWLKPSHEETVNKLTVEDEFYLIDVSFLINGIRLNSRGYFASNNRFVQGSKLRFVVTRDGVIYMDIHDCLYTPVSIGAQKYILTQREMLEEVGHFFDQFLIDSPAYITEMRLEYIAVPENRNNNYELIPVWRCLYSENVDTTGVWLTFNAVTGEYLNI